jgi:L-asparaginase
MKILFIFTGGTIGSTLSDGFIGTESGKAYKIIEAYKERFGIGFEYDMLEPYTELSENNTGDTIRALCECVRDELSGGWDGIIVTHGTDTLAYSSAALGYTIGLDSVPVCVVSSNRPIEHERANALDNLHGAVRFIEGGYGRGVFTVYKNDGSDIVEVHRATRLLGPKAYSDEVSSIYGEAYGSFDRDFNYLENKGYTEAPDAVASLEPKLLRDSSESIRVLYAYPGMCYPELSVNVKYIIINTYHSGTLDTKSDRARAFYKECAERGVSVYATGVSKGPDYASAREFSALSIKELTDISPVAAYVKLWMLSSAGLDADTYMPAPLSGDVR